MRYSTFGQFGYALAIALATLCGEISIFYKLNFLYLLEIHWEINFEAQIINRWTHAHNFIKAKWWILKSAHSPRFFRIHSSRQCFSSIHPPNKNRFGWLCRIFFTIFEFYLQISSSIENLNLLFPTLIFGNYSILKIWNGIVLVPDEKWGKDRALNFATLCLCPTAPK